MQAWVKRGGGDKRKSTTYGTPDFQSLGTASERIPRGNAEAVMRYTPTPEDLDDCLSHGFHPITAMFFYRFTGHRARLDTIAPPRRAYKTWSVEAGDPEALSENITT